MRKLFKLREIYIIHALRDREAEILPVLYQFPPLLSVPKLATSGVCVSCYVGERLQDLMEPRLPRIEPFRASDTGAEAEKAPNPPARPQPPIFARHLEDRIICADATIDESGMRSLQCH